MSPHDSQLQATARHLSDEFLGRVQRSYLLSIDQHAISADSMWTQFAAHNRLVHDALLADDRETLRRIFGDPGSSDLFIGVDNLALTLAAGISQGAASLIDHTRQCVLLLAEAIGIRRWLPAGSEHQKNYYPLGYELSPSIDTVLDELSAALGFDIQFPNPFVGEVGIGTSRGVASYRAIQALYQCHRLRQEMQGIKRQRVIEIGPGMGRTAFYARAAGITDYTTVDLPLGVVSQACFLGAVLGSEGIWMIGDPPSLASGRIRLLPNDQKYFENERFGVALNVDSMTEMGAESSAKYALWLATHADLFLSINHEANDPVIADLARRFFPQAATRRYPYWMRFGYIEEIFGMPDIADASAMDGPVRRALRALRDTIRRYDR
jgi:hypothetical protein